MTCIATDGRSIAGDGRMVAGDMIVDEATKKLWRAADGSAVGGSGEVTELALLREWFRAGEPKDTLPKISDKVCVLILRRDGRVEWMDHHFTPVPWAAPTAIGVGDEMAIGAMLAGKSPRRAVELVASRMMGVGGRIREMRPRRRR